MSEPPVWLEEEREKAACGASLYQLADRRLAASAKQSAGSERIHVKNVARLSCAFRPQECTVITDNEFILKKLKQ